MEKPLWPQWNLLSWFIAPMEKVLFYERLFFEVVIDIVKDIKDTESIKLVLFIT